MGVFFVRVFCKLVLFYTRRKMCNDRNKGLVGHFHNLPKENTCCSPTIGGDGIRQVASDAGVFVRVVLLNRIALHKAKTMQR